MLHCKGQLLALPADYKGNYFGCCSLSVQQCLVFPPLVVTIKGTDYCFHGTVRCLYMVLNMCYDCVLLGSRLNM